MSHCTLFYQEEETQFEAANQPNSYLLPNLQMEACERGPAACAETKHFTVYILTQKTAGGGFAFENKPLVEVQ